MRLESSEESDCDCEEQKKRKILTGKCTHHKINRQIVMGGGDMKRGRRRAQKNVSIIKHCSPEKLQA